MPTLTEALNDFLKVDRSPVTTKNYRRVLSKLLKAVGPEIDIQAVTLAILLTYTKGVREAVQPSSFAQYILVLKTFFSWCQRTGLISLSPALNLTSRNPPRDRSQDRAIPVEHLEAMCWTAYGNPRDYALVLFLADTGARVGGVATLCLKRLDLKEGHALLLEKGRKYVDVHFWGETRAALQRWLAVRPQVDHDFVWTRQRGNPTPLTVSGLSETINRISRRACGVEYGPHSFRHRVAHDWEEAGESPYSIQHKLNHAHLRTTMDTYLRGRDPHIQETSRRLSLARLRLPSAQASPTNILYLDETG